MTAAKDFNISEKEVLNLHKDISKIYNMSVVLSSYCKTEHEIEEINNIIPIVNYIRKESDKLYCILSEICGKY